MTHLYSSMLGVTRRNLYRYAGAVESAFLIDEMSVEVIADGKHLPASLLKLIYKNKGPDRIDRKSTRLNSSHVAMSYAVFCLKEKKARGSKRSRKNADEDGDVLKDM